MASLTPISLVVVHKSAQYPITLLPSETLATLQARLEELTSVPPPLQKLLYKGKKVQGSNELSLAEAGLTDGTKVMLLGSTEREVDGLKAMEAQKQKRDEILKQREARGPSRVRSSAMPSKGSTNFVFHRLEPLGHLPSPDSALALLKRLSADRAIAHIMRIHQFSIGLLTELAPHEDPHLLGLNVNMGQIIKLRLRTDGYDGFRTYGSVRQVLCHELTHCVWSEHDDNFKRLNSQLNREVAEFERAATEGSHTLNGAGDVYEPELALEAESAGHLTTGAFVLGGGTCMRQLPESREERRRRILEATTRRLRQEEETIEEMCGNTSPAAEGPKQ